jgi:glucosamine 6-phosphate synthetase-like amidotransferase/phosphosugar isomerase protein
MCGIAALLLHPQQRSSADWQAIREIFTQNLMFNEARGQAATGLAVIQADGQASIFKQALPARQFVTTVRYQALLETIGPQTTLVLGHTRLPTKGSPANNENNHPLQAGPVLGVHNGRVSNDDVLFERLGLPRQAQVDSEVIFRLLETASPVALNGNYLEVVRPLMQHLQGQYTFLACDLRRSERLLVLKHENPLCLHYEHNWQALIFSSRYTFLRKAFGRAVSAEALEHDRLLWFDANSISTSGAQAVKSCELDAL